MQEMTLREINILKKLNHPNIMRLYYNDNNANQHKMQLEFLPCLDLAKVISLHPKKKLKLELTKLYAVEIIKALHYLRFRKILHRDLKPLNIMIDQSLHIKIADFGCAIDETSDEFIEFITEEDYNKFTELELQTESDQFEDSSINFSISEITTKQGENPIGSYQWMSPEMLMYRKACYASDIWALGCIVYQCLVGKTPFIADTMSQLQDNIRTGTFECPSEMDEDAKDFIEQCLKLKPYERIGN